MAVRREYDAILGAGAETGTAAHPRSGGTERFRASRARGSRVPSILPETRRKSHPCGSPRTSLCSDGLGKDARHAAAPSFERNALGASCQRDAVRSRACGGARSTVPAAPAVLGPWGWSAAIATRRAGAFARGNSPRVFARVRAGASTRLRTMDGPSVGPAGEGAGSGTGEAGELRAADQPHGPGAAGASVALNGSARP
jgi:hypothetical protein